MKTPVCVVLLFVIVGAGYFCYKAHQEYAQSRSEIAGEADASPTDGSVPVAGPTEQAAEQARQKRNVLAGIVVVAVVAFFVADRTMA